MDYTNITLEQRELMVITITTRLTEAMYDFKCTEELPDNSEEVLIDDEENPTWSL